MRREPLDNELSSYILCVHGRAAEAWTSAGFGTSKPGFGMKGWTIFEILRYAPLHNWAAYEEALKENPVLAKISVPCYEGKPLFDFDRTCMFRSGLVGFSLHGSLSHYYYQFCEALFPFQDCIYYVVLGLLRFESPASIFSELKATFIPMLTVGWKLWSFAHLITYGVVLVEQRLLWVDCVELIWVTILST
ncbi:hypothetical protein AQUCO_05900016v1 [Aquilegia coerulea]|uniref:Uncharacterized protein n=1 Tax=Aquilegia coerulea TaxID=218851 RepID=A0A2G5CE29_AQUCA|nr:hypothetical protein AQUCO_05900016v1 [Aquilegia coerulea]